MQLLKGLVNGPEDTFRLPRTVDTSDSARKVKRPTVSTLRKMREVGKVSTGLISQMMLTSSVPLQGVRYHVCVNVTLNVALSLSLARSLSRARALSLALSLSLSQSLCSHLADDVEQQRVSLNPES